jgi:uncharacterized protein YdhG (YjbR/CyaY superfamily)
MKKQPKVRLETGAAGTAALVAKRFAAGADRVGYYAEGATIRLPLDKKLPIALIKKLVRTRIKKNDQAKKLK